MALNQSSNAQQGTLNPQPEPLNGQQLQAIQKKYADAFKAAMADVDLRKWAVDQACSLGAPPPDTDVVKIARSIHSFLTEGVTIS